MSIDIPIQKDVTLAPLTSWRVGGRADYFYSPSTIEELEQALLWAYKNKVPYFLLGGGSNILISDQGVRGLVISMRKLAGVIDEKIDKEFYFANVYAGTHKSQLLKLFLKHQLSPALFLSGLPGDVAGGVVMNAGVSENRVPKEFCEIVDWFEVKKLVNGEIETKLFKSNDVTWNYRESLGWQPGVISKVGLKWKNIPEVDIAKLVKEANLNRLSKQPLDLPSGGSVFKNPVNHKAGALIDQCGLKGFKVGGAMVSEKHANFIVNFNKACAKDIHDIIEKVKSEVHAQKGILLKTEVRYFGDWNIEVQ